MDRSGARQRCDLNRTGFAQQPLLGSGGTVQQLLPRDGEGHAFAALHIDQGHAKQSLLRVQQTPAVAIGQTDLRDGSSEVCTAADGGEQRQQPRIQRGSAGELPVDYRDKLGHLCKK